MSCSKELDWMAIQWHGGRNEPFGEAVVGIEAGKPGPQFSNGA